MKSSTKSAAEGKLREVEGALAEAIGAAARDRDLREARREKKAGKPRATAGRVKRASRK